jgi:hypothetical protein
MAVVVTATILGTSMDAFAMGSGGRRGGGGGGGGETATFSSSSSSEQGSWQNGSYASVPEPGTIVLLASGAAGLALWVRRRRK